MLQGAKTPIGYSGSQESRGITSGNTSLVFERLSQLAKASQHPVSSNNSENIDPKTGQPLFHPQTGRSPKGAYHHQRRNTADGNFSISEHLYSQHKTQLEKQERLKREQ